MEVVGESKNVFFSTVSMVGVRDLLHILWGKRLILVILYLW